MVSIWYAFNLKYVFNTTLKAESVARKNPALIDLPQITGNFFPATFVFVLFFFLFYFFIFSFFFFFFFFAFERLFKSAT